MATQYIQYCVGSERLSLAGRVLPGVPAAEESFLSAMNMKIGMQAMIASPRRHPPADAANHPTMSGAEAAIREENEFASESATALDSPC